MYGDHRFLYQNAITDPAMLTVSSQASGIVSGTQKVGTGSAQLQATGLYTGTTDRVVLVQIDSVSSGVDIGQATYRWRFLDMGIGVWGGSGITTHTAAIVLQDGVYIRFQAGTGDDFVLGDQWTFRVLATWGAKAMIDARRGTSYRSAALQTPNTLEIDLGAVTQIDALVIFDHNLTGDADVTLKMNIAESWTDPPYQEALEVTSPLVVYCDYAARYIRWEIDDSANPDNYIDIALMYAGSYLQLQTTADWGSQETLSFYKQENENPAGVKQQAIYTEQHQWVLNFEDIHNDDVTEILAMFRTVNIPGTRQLKPIFFHLFSDEPEGLTFARLVPDLPRTFTSKDYNTLSLTLEEVVRTRYYPPLSFH